MIGSNINNAKSQTIANKLKGRIVYTGCKSLTSLIGRTEAMSFDDWYFTDEAKNILPESKMKKINNYLKAISINK